MSGTNGSGMLQTLGRVSITFSAMIAALSICVAGSGCSRIASSPGADSLLPLRGATPSISNERVVHSFTGGSDGAYPAGALIPVNGYLYGTTGTGGGSGCGGKGCGTVFKVSPAGQESVVYAFKGGADGEAPVGPLAEVKGNLFGATAHGGGSECKSAYSPGCGTIFEITAAGREHVLYRFTGGAQEAYPSSGLTYVGGNFYGEVAGGNNGLACSAKSTNSCGMVFKMSPSGTISTLYAFSNRGNGAFPSGGLTFFKGNLYGTTGSTVFELTLSGSERTVHAFGAGLGRVSPSGGGVVVLNGELYGANPTSGRYYCSFSVTSSSPCGVVFQLTLSGRIRSIYNFKGNQDGAAPSGLTAYAGSLYGTTFQGGGGCDSLGIGCGTVFKLTPAGLETVLYRFQGSNGSSPDSAPTFAGGAFYGTAPLGGAHNYGTVYELAP